MNSENADAWAKLKVEQTREYYDKALEEKADESKRLKEALEEFQAMIPPAEGKFMEMSLEVQKHEEIAQARHSFIVNLGIFECECADAEGDTAMPTPNVDVVSQREVSYMNTFLREELAQRDAENQQREKAVESRETRVEELQSGMKLLQDNKSQFAGDNASLNAEVARLNEMCGRVWEANPQAGPSEP